MQSDPHDVASVVRSYRLQHILSSGDRPDRLASEEHWWAWEFVNVAAMDGTLTLTLLDEILHDPEAPADYAAYVGAGPIELLLADHADVYADGIADRTRADALWARAVASAWLDRPVWEALPRPLRTLIPKPPKQPRG